MLYTSKKDQKKIMVATVAETRDIIKELNEKILKVKIKKAEIAKELSDLQAELIYRRSVLKDTRDDIKEL